MRLRSYLAIVLVAAAMAPASTAGFNLLVDPYDFRGMLGLSAIDHNRLNLYGPESPILPEWVGKTYNVRWYQPDSVVFGSSSSGGLLDAAEVRNHPEHKFGSRIFHFSVAGPSIGALKNYFLHTAALGPPKLAVLELHFFMFNTDRYKPNEDFLQAAPFAHYPDYEQRFRKSMLEMAVAKQTTRDSMDLLMFRLLPGWTVSRLERELAMLGTAPVAAAGPAPLITADDFRRQFMVVERSIYIGLYHVKGSATFRFQDETGYNTFDDLREILKEARRLGVKLRVYLAPSHARMYEMISFDGRWPMFEQWKRNVVAVFAEDAAAHPDDPIVLWDFSGYNTITVDEFPKESSAAPSLKYFQDTVHWNGLARDLLVDRLFGRDSGRSIPDDFGVVLTPQNVEATIARTRARKSAYERDHADELAELREVLKAVR